MCHVPSIIIIEKISIDITIVGLASARPNYPIKHTGTMAARRYVALQDDVDLAPFIMEGRSTGRQLGGGSYGSVEEVGFFVC